MLPIMMMKGMWPQTKAVFSLPGFGGPGKQLNPSKSRLEERWILKGLLWDTGRINALEKKKNQASAIAADDIYQPTLRILNIPQINHRISGPHFFLKDVSS